MKTYQVLLVRRTYEDCWVEVQAEDEEDAVEKAYDEAGSGFCDWQNAVTDEIWHEDLRELTPYDPREEPDYE